MYMCVYICIKEEGPKRSTYFERQKIQTTHTTYP